MNYKLKTVFIAVLIFLAVFIITQFFIPDKYVMRLFSKTGTLRVESVPKTNVFLNSALIGQTPFQINLKEGVYSIKLVPEAKDARLISWSGPIRVFERTTIYVNRELANKDLLSGGEILSLSKLSDKQTQIWVSTDPQGVFVSLDGQDRGVSPVYMDNVSPGNHELAVYGDGFLARSLKVNVIQGYKLTADFKLVKDTKYKPVLPKAKKPQKPQKLLIKQTPTGWLRVREEPSLNASESAQVLPGEEFVYFNQEDNWYEIEYTEGQKGWVSGEYVELITEPTPTPTDEETE